MRIISIAVLILALLAGSSMAMDVDYEAEISLWQSKYQVIMTQITQLEEGKQRIMGAIFVLQQLKAKEDAVEEAKRIAEEAAKEGPVVSTDVVDVEEMKIMPISEGEMRSLSGKEVKDE